MCELDCDKKMNMVILLDKSGSIKRRNFRKMQVFTKELAEVMPISFDETHVAVVCFTHIVREEWNFGSNKAKNLAAFREAIDGIRYRQEGGTRTDLALEQAYKTFKSVDVERRDILQVVLVITDGRTEDGSKPYPEVLKPFKVMSYYGCLASNFTASGKPDKLSKICVSPKKKNHLILVPFLFGIYR